jgi:hypothetical protein
MTALSSGTAATSSTYFDGNYVAQLNYSINSATGGANIGLNVPLQIKSGGAIHAYVNPYTPGGTGNVVYTIFNFGASVPLICDAGFAPNLQFTSYLASSPVLISQKTVYP